MTRRALIGHTGFVGSNLDAAETFTDRYNSANIEAMAGGAYDEIVCAGVSAVKWMANREPDKDWAGIERLLDVLATTRTARFTLISTIDVYPDPALPLDETADLADLDNHAYGRHRLKIEAFVRERFADCLVVRLPALFGPGLKKNALFDLMNDNGTDAINPAAAFQWYPVERLSADIAVARDGGLPLVNLFTEPVTMAAVIERMFPDANVGPARELAPRYDLRTAHAALFGASGGYRMDADAVLAAMDAYVRSARAGRPS